MSVSNISSLEGGGGGGGGGVFASSTSACFSCSNFSLFKNLTNRKIEKDIIKKNPQLFV